MRKTLFWLVLAVLLALSAAAGAGTYWNLFELDVLGISRQNAEFIYWGLGGGVVGYLLGSVLVPRSDAKARTRAVAVDE